MDGERIYYCIIKTLPWTARPITSEGHPKLFYPSCLSPLRGACRHSGPQRTPQQLARPKGAPAAPALTCQVQAHMAEKKQGSMPQVSPFHCCTPDTCTVGRRVQARGLKGGSARSAGSSVRQEEGAGSVRLPAAGCGSLHELVRHRQTRLTSAYFQIKPMAAAHSITEDVCTAHVGRLSALAGSACTTASAGSAASSAASPAAAATAAAGLPALLLALALLARGAGGGPPAPPLSCCSCGHPWALQAPARRRLWVPYTPKAPLRGLKRPHFLLAMGVGVPLLRPAHTDIVIKSASRRCFRIPLPSVACPLDSHTGG